MVSGRPGGEDSVRRGHMKVITRFLAIFCFLLCVCPPLPAQQAKIAAPSVVQNQDVDVGGHKLRLQVAGTGRPTVVLDYGLGGSVENWSDVFPEVARFARVVAYDRAGYGKSEQG